MLVHSLVYLTLAAGLLGAQEADLLPPNVERDGSHAAYLLGPHDQIRIIAAHAQEISSEPFRIGPDGSVNLPFIGRMRVSGMSVETLEATLQDKLKEYVREPQVSVQVVDSRNRPVSVIGAVKSPGVHQLREPTRLIEILSLAGGLREDSGSKLRVTRQRRWGPLPLPGAQPDPSGSFSVAEVDLEGMIRGANPAENIYVQPNDVISVPRAEIVYVMGEVKKPGGFPLRDREKVHVMQALAMAEGMLVTAGPKHARIMRVNPAGGERVEIPVDVRKVLEGRGVDVAMQADDILMIPNNAARSVALRTAETALQIATGVIIWRR